MWTREQAAEYYAQNPQAYEAWRAQAGQPGSLNYGSFAEQAATGRNPNAPVQPDPTQQTQIDAANRAAQRNDYQAYKNQLAPDLNKAYWDLVARTMGSDYSQYQNFIKNYNERGANVAATLSPAYWGLDPNDPRLADYITRHVTPNPQGGANVSYGWKNGAAARDFYTSLMGQNDVVGYLSGLGYNKPVKGYQPDNRNQWYADEAARMRAANPAAWNSGMLGTTAQPTGPAAYNVGSAPVSFSAAPLTGSAGAMRTREPMLSPNIAQGPLPTVQDTSNWQAQPTAYTPTQLNTSGMFL